MNLQAGPVITVNHHSDQAGFAGLTGLLVGLVMNISGRALARLVADLAAVSNGDRVVDVGCGPGTAAREAARRGAQVQGVDPAPIMLRLARALTRERAGIMWTEGTAEDLPQPDRSASVLWAIATVHHWRDAAQGLAQARRVLAPGGRLLAIERQVRAGATGCASHGWSEQQAHAFAVMCQAAGFENVRIEEHAAGRRAVYAVRAVKPPA